MKTLLIGLGILVGLASCDAPSMDDKTTMKVEALYSNGKKVEGTSFNAGSVVKGELVKAKFVLTNTGNIDLIIGDVNPSCKCMLRRNLPSPSNQEERTYWKHR